jgi:hypothetical protein
MGVLPVALSTGDVVLFSIKPESRLRHVGWGELALY